MTITCEYYDIRQAKTARIAQEEIPALLQDRRRVLWIDIEQPSDEELAWARRTFGIPGRIADSLKQRQGDAHFDWEGDVTLLTLTAVHYHCGSNEIVRSMVHLVSGDPYLLTLQYRPLGELNALSRAWQEAKLPDNVIPYCQFLLADSIVDTYSVVSDVIGSRIDEIKTPASAVRKPEQVIQSIILLRSRIHDLLSLLRPFRNAFHDMLRIQEGRLPGTLDKTRTYSDYITSHLGNIKDEAYTYLDMLDRIVEMYRTHQENDLNLVVTRLTIATILLSSGAVITGFYGMNLQGLLINSQSRYAIVVPLALLAVTATAELWYFYKKGWLKRF